jgi:hypothetical protein
MARPVAVDPHDRRRSPHQCPTSLSHQLKRTLGEKQRSRSYKRPGQRVHAASLAHTMSGALDAGDCGATAVLVAGERGQHGHGGTTSWWRTRTTGCGVMPAREHSGPALLQADSRDIGLPLAGCHRKGSRNAAVRRAAQAPAPRRYPPGRCRRGTAQSHQQCPAPQPGVHRGGHPGRDRV